MNGSPGWIRLLAASCWMAGLVAVASGPAPHAWQPSVEDRWLWPAVAATTVDSGFATVDRSGAGWHTADVLVLDPFVTAEQAVSDLHSRGRAVVCRLRGGVWEAGRPDEARLDASLVGAGASPSAHWLDVRNWEALAPVLADRLALCVAKGFDGVVLVDLDGFAHPTGFPLTAGDQRRFNTALVRLAHRYGLRVAMVATAWTPVPAEVDVVLTGPR